MSVNIDTNIPTPVFLDPASHVDLFPRATDTNVGQARTLQNASASAVLSTLGPTSLVAFGFLVAFLLLRRIYPRVYYPRSFLSSLRPQERSPKLPNTLINWVSTFWTTSDLVVLNSHTLDGYLFLRHLKVAIITCIVGICITWPVLLPVNATGPGGQNQLNLLTIANATAASDANSFYRYYAHVLCAYLFFGFVIHMIARESIYYINLRQAYLVSPLYAERVSSRTVLFTSTPEEYLDSGVIRRLFGEDIVKHVWIPRNIDELKEAVEKRDKIAMKLEKAEITLIKKANEVRLKKAKKDMKGQGEEMKALRRSESIQPGDDHNSHDEGVKEENWSNWVEQKDRPTHRLGNFGFIGIGKKVDTIDWCRQELERAIPEVEEMQQGHRKGRGRPYSSVFVEFATLKDAQSAYQSLTHHESLHMAPRYTGIHPAELIWSNMRIRWFERIVRFVLTTAFWIGLILFWSFPVTFISSISNVASLSALPGLQWLSFLQNLPTWASGLVTGLLPSILLSVLMSLLPPVLRLVAQLGGDPTLSAVEYSVQNSYFWFYVIQVFLVTTLSSGALQAAQQIFDSPISAVNLLADALPSSSNFYLSYIVLQGLGVVSSILVSAISLLLYLLLGKFLDSTPRAMFKRWINLSNPGMGTLYPIYTTMFIIAISYACIAPLVLAFAAIGLFFFYLAFRYEFLYVYNVPYDTKGLMYARALQQLFVGLYLAQLCLIGLFALAVKQSTNALGPLILMIIFLVFTVLCHASLYIALAPLLQYLPKTLETEEQRLLDMENGDEESAKQGRESIQSTHPLTDGAENNGATNHAFYDRIGDALPAMNHWKKRHENKSDNPSFIVKWFRPSTYQDYYTLRKLVPRDFPKIEYDKATEAETYFHPAVISLPPTLWVPRDRMGVSRRECHESGQVIPMSDEAAHLDEKNNVVWDKDRASEVPVAAEKIYW